MIRDKILLYNNLKEINTECFCCSKNDHFTINCPLIHYSPNYHFVIGRYNYSFQNRMKFLRKIIKSSKFNAFKIKHNTPMKNFLTLNEDIINYYEQNFYSIPEEYKLMENSITLFEEIEKKSIPKLKKSKSNFFHFNNSPSLRKQISFVLAENFTFDSQMHKIKIFEVYFPYNNFKNVINIYKKRQKLKEISIRTKNNII